MNDTILQGMIAYSTAMLQALSNWLSAEPIIYLFGVIVGCFVINMLLSVFFYRRY